MLQVRVLGELVVEDGGRRVELGGSWRARSLLAWLALNPGTHPRGDLASRFWPDVLDTSARASLRSALWAIRRALGDESAEAVVATRERVGLDEAQAWIDSAAFDEHLAADELDEALALSRGELLAGLDEDWVLEHRDAHRERLSDLFERLAERDGSRGDLAGAVGWSRRRAALDPFAEEAHRALFARLVAAGDRAGALSAYERLRYRLLTEIGISPSEETMAAVQELRGSVPPAPVEPASVPTVLPDRLAQAAATPWIGRERQLARLRLELQRSQGGQTRLLMVAGEGGIGKTRLLAELAQGAEDCAVLYGRCDEDELFPFGPYIEALGGHLADLPDTELPGLLGEAGPDLARLLPELRARVPDMPQSPATDPETERARLFSGVAAVLGRMAERYPLLCIIDDLHWADRSSLLMGKHLARAGGLGRVLLVGTYRDTELHDGHPLAEVLADLERDDPIERIALEGLGGDEVTALTGAQGQELDEATVDAVHDETRGNPFFVKQLLRHLEEEGTTPGGDGVALPTGLRDVVVRRVARLPGAADQVLRVAAIIGRDFDLELVEQVADVSEDEVLDALDAAVRGGILIEVDSTPGRYSFVHALLRTTLEEDLTATRRARLHSHVGDAIEAVYGNRLDLYLDDLARHFGAAGPQQALRAVDYAEKAAEQAKGRLAYEEAVRLLADAVAASEQAGGEPAHRARLLWSLAGARWMAGQHDAAREDFAASAAAARAAGAAEAFAEAALGHAGGLFERYGSDDPEAAALLRESLDSLPSQDSNLRARVLSRLSGVLYYSPGSEETAATLAEEAVAMARRLRDDEALASGLAAALFTQWRPGALEVRLELADELVETTRRLDDPAAVAVALPFRQGPLLELCRRDEAEATLREYTELAERLRATEMLVQAKAFACTFALLDGRWADAESLTEEGMAIGEGSTGLYAAFQGGQKMAQLQHRLRLGEMAEWFRVFARDTPTLPGWNAVAGWAYAQSGEDDLALEAIEGIRPNGFAGLPRDANYQPSLAILSHVAAELSNAELASELEPLLLPFTGLWMIMGVGGSEVGPVDLCLGLVRLELGKREEAAADFERALARSRDMRARPHEAYSLLGLSKALGRDELRDEAVAIAEELGGMERLLRDANS